MKAPNKIIKRNNNSKEVESSANFGFSFETRKEVFTYLYALLHGSGLYHAEVIVYNPNPSKAPVAGAIPSDTYLWEEQKKMSTMDFDQFLDFCEDLVGTKSVPCIGVSGGIYGKNSIRIGAQAYFDPSIIPVDENSEPLTLTDNEIPVFCSVAGSTPAKNEKISREIEAKANKEFDRLLGI